MPRAQRKRCKVCCETLRADGSCTWKCVPLPEPKRAAPRERESFFLSPEEAAAGLARVNPNYELERAKARGRVLRGLRTKGQGR